MPEARRSVSWTSRSWSGVTDSGVPGRMSTLDVITAMGARVFKHSGNVIKEVIFDLAIVEQEVRDVGGLAHVAAVRFDGFDRDGGAGENFGAPMLRRHPTPANCARP